MPTKLIVGLEEPRTRTIDKLKEWSVRYTVAIAARRDLGPFIEAALIRELPLLQVLPPLEEGDTMVFAIKCEPHQTAELKLAVLPVVDEWITGMMA